MGSSQQHLGSSASPPPKPGEATNLTSPLALVLFHSKCYTHSTCVCRQNICLCLPQVRVQAKAQVRLQAMATRRGLGVSRSRLLNSKRRSARARPDKFGRSIFIRARITHHIFLLECNPPGGQPDQALRARSRRREL